MSRSYGRQGRNSNQKAQRQRGRVSHRGAERSTPASGSALGTVTHLSTVACLARNRCLPGVVAYASVDYDDGSGSKCRPVVVLGAVGRFDVLVLKCTTQDATARRRGHRKISDLLASGLVRDTWVELKPVVIARSDVNQIRGKLSETDDLAILGAAQHHFGGFGDNVPA